MATCAPRLEVSEQRLWRDVSLKSHRVSEFLHLRVFDDGKDELHSLLPRRLVDAAVGLLGFVRCYRAHTDNGHGIVINHGVVSANSCGFDEFLAVAHCIRYHRPNEVNKFVFAYHLVVQDLEEEQFQDLPDLREVGVGWMAVYWIELFERISEFPHNFSGVTVPGVRGFGDGSSLFRIKCSLRWL